MQYFAFAENYGFAGCVKSYRGLDTMKSLETVTDVFCLVAVFLF